MGKYYGDISAFIIYGLLVIDNVPIVLKPVFSDFRHNVTDSIYFSYIFDLKISPNNGMLFKCLTESLDFVI